MHVSNLSPTRKAGAALGALALFGIAATSSYALVTDDTLKRDINNIRRQLKLPPIR